MVGHDLQLDVHARAASSTSPETCSSCGSSATTSRTRWGARATSPSTSSAGSSRPTRRRCSTPGRRSRRSAPAGRSPAYSAATRCYTRRARVLTLIFIIFFVTVVEIPALIMLGIWFVLQFLPAVGQLATRGLGEGGGVAYFAHVGGFIFGLALIKLFANRRHDEPGRSPRSTESADGQRRQNSRARRRGPLLRVFAADDARVVADAASTCSAWRPSRSSRSC